MARRVRWSMYHVSGRTPQFVGDSRRGILLAVKAGKGKIDLNMLITKDGVIVCTHWPRPLVHGFRWADDAPAYLKRKSRFVKISDLTYAEVRWLRAKYKGKTYVISSMVSLIAYAHARGMGVEAETKPDPRFENPETYASLRRVYDTLKPNMVVKVVANVVSRRGKYIEAIHAAGLPVLYSTNGKWITKAQAKFVSFYRGAWRVK